MAILASVRHQADELKDEKGARAAHDCGLDEAKMHFFGDNVAVVYGREHAIGKDKSQPSAKVCQVWTDRWLKRVGTRFLLKKNTILETGPTGPLAGRDSNANTVGGWAGVMSAAFLRLLALSLSSNLKERNLSPRSQAIRRQAIGELRLQW